jgi:FimV-like protein
VKQILILILSALLLSATVFAKPNKATRYGPVASGETLWSIAYKTRPKKVSRLHMMRALHRYNPHAFRGGNINRLKKGVYLKIPNLPTIYSLLSGKKIAAAPGDSAENSAELEKLRVQLAQATQDLAQKTEELENLKQQTEKAMQLSQINDQQKTEVASLTKELLAAREELDKLTQKTEALQQQTTEKHNIELASVTTELKETREQLAALKQQNEELQAKTQNTDEDTDNTQLASITNELSQVREEYDALKVQNELLREQAAEAENLKAAEAKKNKEVSATIAALNSDIGTLRSRVKELEELQTLKDTHIAELKKALDHATVVMKEQADINAKMYAKLNELEKRVATAPAQPSLKVLGVDGNNGDSAEQSTEDKAMIAGSTNAQGPTGGADNTATPIPAPAVMSADASLSRHISPKFWLLLILAGLLFILALIWRSLSGVKPQAT